MNHSTFIVILLVLFTTNKYANAGKENNRPIIGVLTVPLDIGGCVTYASMIESTKDGVAPTSCFHNLYVQWTLSAYTGLRHKYSLFCHTTRCTCRGISETTSVL